MNIWERIKIFFRGNKQKKLPAPQNQKEELNNGHVQNGQRQNFKNGIVQTAQNKKQEICNNPQLAGAIDEYFKSYEQLMLEQAKTGVQANAYTALIRINAVGGDVEHNAIQEQALLRNLETSDKYKLRYVQKSNNVPAFYHISTKSCEDAVGDNMVRMYLNCRNEHVAEIASNLLELNERDNFYFKIDANEYLKSRKEKVRKNGNLY